MNASAKAPISKTAKPVLPRKWGGKAVFDVYEVAEIFEMSPWAIYEAIKKGELRAVRIGRLLKVSRQVVEGMLAA